MKGRRFAIISVLSLLLCLFMAAIWVRSYWQVYETAFPGVLPNTSLAIGSHYGLLGCSWTVDQSGSEKAYLPSPGPAARHLVTFIVAKRYRTPFQPISNSHPAIYYYYFACPHWAPTLAFAVLPFLWLRRKREPVAEQACPACGYDLHASPGNCPECGWPKRGS